MANRFMLNETSYHGYGAIKEIANEAKARAFKKAFVCSDPDLIKLNPYLHSVDKNLWLSVLFAEFIPIIEGFWAM